MPSQGQVEKCLGCGHNAFHDKLSPVLVPGGTRSIGYVHKTPPTAREGLIPSCHRFAYKKLQHRFASIVIETRTLDQNTKFVSSGRPSGSYRAVSGSAAVKFAERRNNEPAAGYNVPSASVTLRTPNY